MYSTLFQRGIHVECLLGSLGLLEHFVFPSSVSNSEIVWFCILSFKYIEINLAKLSAFKLQYNTYTKFCTFCMVTFQLVIWQTFNDRFDFLLQIFFIVEISQPLFQPGDCNVLVCGGIFGKCPSILFQAKFRVFPPITCSGAILLVLLANPS